MTKFLNNLTNIKIRIGTPEESFQVSQQIPEFTEKYSLADYKKRIGDKFALILIACIKGQPIGFKLGYLEKGYFYSWLGGVVPAFRNKGVASHLAKKQELMLLKKGIKKIRFKTLNRFRGMLIFALKNNLQIIGTEPFTQENTIKILLEKQLK